jgi:hypothetical protein
MNGKENFHNGGTGVSKWNLFACSVAAKLAIAEKFCIKTCRYSVSVLIEPKKIADKEAPCNAICG